MKTITEIIADEWGTTPEKMFLSRNTREQPMADARLFLLFFLAYVLRLGPSYIGAAFQYRHSSICYTKKATLNLIETDKAFYRHVKVILEYLNNNKYLVEFPRVETKRKVVFNDYSFGYDYLKANSVIKIKEEVMV